MSELGADVERHAIRIRTLDPHDEDWSDLEPLGALLADAKVIGVGESAHRVREFQLLKHRLLRFMVRELGVTAFAMESGFPEGLRVSRWLAGDEDDLDIVLERGFTNAFGNSEEMRAQLLWMRAHGVRFYGIDVPGTGITPNAALDEIERFDSELGQRLRAELADITPSTGQPIEGNRLASLTTLLTGAARDLRRHDDEPAAHRVAVHKCVEGLLAYVEMAATEGAFDVRRDTAMADMVGWIAEREPRVLLGGANAHVQRVAYTTRFGLLRVLGQQLSERLGHDYVAVGTTFTTGTCLTLSSGPWTFPAPADDDATADALLASTAMPLFAVETRWIPDGPPACAMREFDGVVSIDVRAAFDVLVHVADFGPATAPRTS